MRKILVVNMNYLGDALLTTPALAALRRAYPDACIDTVVGEGAAAEVMRDNPDLDHIIARTARGSWGRCVQIYQLLREGRYTDAVILPPLPAYAAAAWAARTPRRIGQAGRGMNHFLTDLRETKALHMAEALLDTVPVPEAARPTRRRLSVAVEKEAIESVDALLSEAGLDPEAPLIAVNVGATRPQKRWFADRFAATLDHLADLQIVLIGAGEQDKTLAGEILGLVREAKPVNLIGRTDVKQLAALLEISDILVSADSGPMHLATAVGTPTVALFGSTNPLATGPYDGVSRVIYKSLPCAPCGNHPTCDGRYDCLRAIAPEEVADSVRSLLLERRPLDELPDSVTAEADPPLAVQQRAERTGPRILIVTKFRFIGDTLLAIPIFRAARAQWPDAHIALLTGRNARTLLQNNPYLDEIIEFDPYQRDHGPRGDLRLVRRLRSGRFEICLSLNRSFHSALTPWLGGVRLRAGFDCEGRGALLTHRVAYDKEKSEIACYFDVLRAVAPETPVNPALELWVSGPERAQAADSLHDAFGHDLTGLRLLGIQPGASLSGKQWPAPRYARVAERLLETDAQARIVLIGGPDERAAAAAMLAEMSDAARQRTADLVGACNLRGSLALVSHLHLFIGNDTAIMHSAVALGVPTVALFGPTNPRKWGNYGPRHRVLESATGEMDALTVEEVAGAAGELLAMVVSEGGFWV